MTKTLRKRLTLLGTTSLFALAMAVAPVQLGSDSFTLDKAVAQAASPGGGGTTGEGGAGGHDGDGGEGGRDNSGGSGSSNTGGGGGGSTTTDSSGGASTDPGGR